MDARLQEGPFCQHLGLRLLPRVRRDGHPRHLRRHLWDARSLRYQRQPERLLLPLARWLMMMIHVVREVVLVTHTVGGMR